jgi:hypothetical protein
VEYGNITFPLAGHCQQRCPTGGQDDCGTEEDGLTAAVLVEDFDLDFVFADAVLVFAPPLTLSFCPTSMV